MPILRIHMLGSLDVAWGDQALAPISGAAARSLFAYLVTHRDRAHTRDLLAGTFWPDEPDATARRRLSQALWQIGRAFRQVQHPGGEPLPIILSEGDTIRIDPDLPLWIDVEEFSRHRTLCAPAAGRAAESAVATTKLCRECVDHYRGDYLAGYYDDWIVLERERLREQYLDVLEQLAVGLKSLGDYQAALTYARRLAMEDPLSESAHCEIMRLYHLLGQDSEALRQFRTCREVLAEELGVEPSASTVALADEIAALAGCIDLPHLPVAARPLPAILTERPDRVPLVGRLAEREQMSRYLDMCTAGNGGMVLLLAAPGVGKTRLMQEVARDAAWRNVQVGWGHCCELSTPLPYQPLVEVLHDVDLSALPAVWKQELVRLLPELASARQPNSREPETGHLFEALARAFLSLSSPYLVILEDVHWMDPASLEVLRVLLPRLPTSHLLVVCTLRPEELPSQPIARRAMGALEATHLPRRLELAPLTPGETEAMIQRVLSLPEPAPRFSQRIYSGTAGNPFFVTETLRTLIDEGHLARDRSGEWHTPWDQDADDYAELPVPPSVAQSIQQRVARLAPSVQSLLGVAAVIGRRVEFDLWLAAADCDEDTAMAAAEDLAQRGILAEMDDVPGYSFAHDTIRRVVYEELSPIRLRHLHRRVASALLFQHPDQVEALARHYHLGQKWPDAVQYALRAGARAQAVYANQQALEHYRLAERWLGEGLVDWPAEEITRWQADLAERQGRIQALIGAYDQAQESFTHARHRWASLGDWRGNARILNRLSFTCFVQDNCGGAVDYAQEALAILREVEARDPSEAEEQGRAAMASMQEREEALADLQATSLTYLGLCAWTQGQYDKALPYLEEALDLFEKCATDLHGLARCLNSLGQVHLGRGDLELASDCFARSLALRQQIGDRRGEAWCWYNQGRTELARGDIASAREKLESAQTIFAEIQHPHGLENVAHWLVQAEQVEASAEPDGQAKVRLPRADAPLGRPLADGEFVDVVWTLDAPEDSGIRGKTARRRHRILRLLAEAQAQGAVPRDQDLAEVLGVSLTTLRRDMAALRGEGHETPTRWRKMATRSGDGSPG